MLAFLIVGVAVLVVVGLGVAALFRLIGVRALVGLAILVWIALMAVWIALTSTG